MFLTVVQYKEFYSIMIAYDKLQCTIHFLSIEEIKCSINYIYFTYHTNVLLCHNHFKHNIT